MKKKNFLFAGIMIFSLFVMNQFVNAQIKPYGKKYAKCNCSLPNYGCKSYPCFVDCDRVCTIIMRTSLNNSTKVSVSLLKTEKVLVQISDLAGHSIKKLADGLMQKGVYQLGWDGKDENGNAVDNGVYFAKLNAGSYSEIKKILIFN
jgi:hypothetical protein